MRRRTQALALVAGWIAAALAADARADVDVTGGAGCFDAERMRERVESVLAEYRPAGSATPEVRIRALAADSATELRVEALAADGTVALERSYSLTTADCASAIDLVAAVVARYLESLPAESWPRATPVEPDPQQAPAEEPPAEPPEPWLLDVELFARAGGAATVWPLDRSSSGTRRPGLDGELALGAEAVTPSGGASLAVVGRAAASRRLGTGGYRSLFALAELAWRTRGRWRLGPIARVGSLRVTGSGFDDNFSRWLLWIEGGAGAGLRLGRLELSVDAALSPLSQDIVTADRGARTTAPRARIGLSVRASL